MQQTFEVQNLKCGGCASTITKKLSESFQNVSVDVEAKTVTLDAEESQLDEVKAKLRSLGYPLKGEEMGFLADTGAKAKSFVSCAVGRMDSDKS